MILLKIEKLFLELKSKLFILLNKTKKQKPVLFGTPEVTILSLNKTTTTGCQISWETNRELNKNEFFLFSFKSVRSQHLDFFGDIENQKRNYIFTELKPNTKYKFSIKTNKSEKEKDICFYTKEK